MNVKCNLRYGRSRARPGRRPKWSAAEVRGRSELVRRGARLGVGATFGEGTGEGEPTAQHRLAFGRQLTSKWFKCARIALWKRLPMGDSHTFQPLVAQLVSGCDQAPPP